MEMKAHQWVEAEEATVVLMQVTVRMAVGAGAAVEVLAGVVVAVDTIGDLTEAVEADREDVEAWGKCLLSSTRKVN